MPFIEEFSRNWNCSLPAVETGKRCDGAADLCYNGKCVDTESGHRYLGGTIQRCECDVGWLTLPGSNADCSTCCDMPCVNDGECQIEPTTQLPFCYCHEYK